MERKFQRTEHQEQAVVVEWARWNATVYPPLRWLHAIPNGAALPQVERGGHRYSPQAMKLKAEGLTPGVFDLCLPWPAKGYHGIYIEMKRPGALSQVRDGQKEFAAYCEQAGYLAQVYDSADDAIAALTDYLS